MKIKTALPLNQKLFVLFAIIAVIFAFIFIAPCAQHVSAAELEGEITVNIPVHKSVIGDTPSTDEAFSFTLTAQDQAPMPSGSRNGSKTVVITGSGTAYFGEISYSSVGEYHYTVSEVSGNDSRYQYDESEYEVIVRVTWVNMDENEKQAVIYVTKHGGETKTDDILFTNIYTDPYHPPAPVPPPAVYEPEINKVVSGDKPTANSEFTFVLEARSLSFPMPKRSSDGKISAVIVGEGTTGLGEITYDRSGIYMYDIYEVIDSIDGYSYDRTVYTLTVTVTLKDGSLVCDAVITAGGKNVSSIVFENKYTAPDEEYENDKIPTSINLPIYKTISGDKAENAHTFAFEFAADNSAYPMPAGSLNGVKILTIVGEGSVQIGDIIFDKAGEYSYTVREIAASVKGYTYDSTVYTLKVIVTEMSEELTAEWLITNSNGDLRDKIQFINEYTREEDPPADPPIPPEEHDEPRPPQTGDQTIQVLWCILCISIIGIVSAVLLKKKRDN